MPRRAGGLWWEGFGCIRTCATDQVRALSKSLTSVSCTVTWEQMNAKRHRACKSTRQWAEPKGIERLEEWKVKHREIFLSHNSKEMLSLHLNAFGDSTHSLTRKSLPPAILKLP